MEIRRQRDQKLGVIIRLCAIACVEYKMWPDAFWRNPTADL
jgi:hypothetical protein